MADQTLSMREASRVLGVSQLRVRELIRKGTLHAQKIADEAGERWTIVSSSVDEYMSKRPARTDGLARGNGHRDGAEQAFGVLIRGLEGQLDRVRNLVEELGKAQAYIDGLRGAQTAIEAEIKQARARASEIRDLARKARQEASAHDGATPAEFARRAVEAAKQAVAAVRHEAPKAGGPGRGETKGQTKGEAKDAKPKDAKPKDAKPKDAKAKGAAKPSGKATGDNAPQGAGKPEGRPKAGAAAKPPSPKQEAQPAPAPEPAAKSAPAKAAAPAGSKNGGRSGRETAMAAALRQAGVDKPQTAAKPRKKAPAKKK